MAGEQGSFVLFWEPGGIPRGASSEWVGGRLPTGLHFSTSCVQRTGSGASETPVPLRLRPRCLLNLGTGVGGQAGSGLEVAPKAVVGLSPGQKVRSPGCPQPSAAAGALAYRVHPASDRGAVCMED